jgi:hypothetical protein
MEWTTPQHEEIVLNCEISSSRTPKLDLPLHRLSKIRSWASARLVLLVRSCLLDILSLDNSLPAERVATRMNAFHAN